MYKSPTKIHDVHKAIYWAVSFSVVRSLHDIVPTAKVRKKYKIAFFDFVHVWFGFAYCDYYFVIFFTATFHHLYRWRMNELYEFTCWFFYSVVFCFLFVWGKIFWYDKRNFICFCFHINLVIGWTLCRNCKSEQCNNISTGKRNKKRMRERKRNTIFMCEREKIQQSNEKAIRQQQICGHEKNGSIKDWNTIQKNVTHTEILNWYPCRIDTHLKKMFSHFFLRLCVFIRLHIFQSKKKTPLHILNMNIGKI